MSTKIMKRNAKAKIMKRSGLRSSDSPTQRNIIKLQEQQDTKDTRTQEMHNLSFMTCCNLYRTHPYHHRMRFISNLRSFKGDIRGQVSRFRFHHVSSFTFAFPSRLAFPNALDIARSPLMPAAAKSEGLTSAWR